MQHDIKDATNTGIEKSRCKDLGLLITALPKDVDFHRLVKKIFEARIKSI